MESQVKFHLTTIDELKHKFINFFSPSIAKHGSFYNWLIVSYDNMILEMKGLKHYIHKYNNEEAISVRKDVLKLSKLIKFLHVKLEYSVKTNSLKNKQLVDFYERVNTLICLLDDIDNMLFLQSISPVSKSDMVKMSMDERRKILKAQSIMMANHYLEDQSWNDITSITDDFFNYETLNNAIQ